MKPQRDPGEEENEASVRSGRGRFPERRQDGFSGRSGN